MEGRHQEEIGACVNAGEVRRRDHAQVLHVLFDAQPVDQGKLAAGERPANLHKDHLRPQSRNQERNGSQYAFDVLIYPAVANVEDAHRTAIPLFPTIAIFAVERPEPLRHALKNDIHSTWIVVREAQEIVARTLRNRDHGGNAPDNGQVQAAAEHGQAGIGVNR